MQDIQEELLEEGYVKYVNPAYYTFHNTDTLYQKKVVDEKGIKYFIDCWCYPRVICSEYWQFEVQFSGGCLPEDSLVTDTINICLFERDIDKAEKTIHNIWTSLRLGYYEMK